MYQNLDDPVALPPSTPARRQATLRRGQTLRRRRRAVAILVPSGVAAAAWAVLAAGLFALPQDSGQGITLDPAAPPAESAPVLPLKSIDDVADLAEPGHTVCEDPAGDSVGEPDILAVNLDRPAFPFLHWHWDGKLTDAGRVEALVRATSADGLRSRQLVVEIVDGQVVAQFVRDPATGDRQIVEHDGFTDTIDGGTGGGARAVDFSVEGLGASFPGAAFSPLGDGWTYAASLTVDGIVVDACDAASGSTVSP